MARTIATNTRADREELLEFLRPRHHAILMTTRKDGRPQSSPNTCGVDTEGRIVISKYPERAKVTNIRRNPQVSVCVLSDEWNGPWVQVDGTAVRPLAKGIVDAMVGLAHVGHGVFERPQQTDSAAVGASEEIEGFGSLSTREDVDVLGRDAALLERSYCGHDLVLALE